MIELMKCLKAYTENTQVLHRNVYGIDFYPTHEQLGSYYDTLQAMTDDIIEISIALGYKEEKFSTDELIEVKERNSKESFTEVKKMFDDIIVEINRIKDVPADVINKLQGYQETLRKESEYKLAKAIK